MKIKEKLLMDKEGLIENGPIDIVIFGDSVSHGALNGYYDYENVYWNLLKKKLNAFRDYVPVNMINNSVGGTSARSSLKRLPHVLKHSPDLVIVCFGLNDVNGELDSYLGALREIFTKCRDIGSEVIFMTSNMLNTYVAEDTPPQYFEYAHKTAAMQNEGRMDLFMEAAKGLAKEMDVPVCDCYAKWKILAEKEDTTRLLANRINHPISEMHALFADSLYAMLIDEDEEAANAEDGMYRA